MQQAGARHALHMIQRQIAMALLYVQNLVPKSTAPVAALPEPSRAASVPQQLQSLQLVLEQAASSRDGAGFLPASFGSGTPSSTSYKD